MNSFNTVPIFLSQMQGNEVNKKSRFKSRKNRKIKVCVQNLKVRIKVNPQIYAHLNKFFISIMKFFFLKRNLQYKNMLI